jgi:hypothetical protein
VCPWLPYRLLTLRVSFQLRDIEVIVQEKLTDAATLEPEKVTLLKIQEILYSTEARHPSLVHLVLIPAGGTDHPARPLPAPQEGFEVPDADLPAEQLASTSIQDDETF